MSQRVLTLFRGCIPEQPNALKHPATPILRKIMFSLHPINIHFGTSMSCHTSMSCRTRRLLLQVAAMLLAAALCCRPVASRAILAGDQNPDEANYDATGEY